MMNKNSNEYVLIDWKTSKRIDKKSFNGKKHGVSSGCLPLTALAAALTRD